MRSLDYYNMVIADTYCIIYSVIDGRLFQYKIYAKEVM